MVSGQGVGSACLELEGLELEVSPDVDGDRSKPLLGPLPCCHFEPGPYDGHPGPSWGWEEAPRALTLCSGPGGAVPSDT